MRSHAMERALKKTFSYVASFLATIGFMGVVQWRLNPDAAPFAVICGIPSIVPCLIHYSLSLRVSKRAIRIALLWAPAGVLVALWFFWTPNIPDHEGGRQLSRVLLLYTGFGWFFASLLLLLISRVLKLQKREGGSTVPSA